MSAAELKQQGVDHASVGEHLKAAGAFTKALKVAHVEEQAALLCDRCFALLQLNKHSKVIVVTSIAILICIDRHWPMLRRAQIVTQNLPRVITDSARFSLPWVEEVKLRMPLLVPLSWILHFNERQRTPPTAKRVQYKTQCSMANAIPSAAAVVA